MTLLATPTPNEPPLARNYNFGFPFTTGTVLVRNTGTVDGDPLVATLTAMGNDTVTAMGARNISLVAGGLAATPLFGTVTPTLNQISMPEPGVPLSRAAGVLALLAIAAWRSRNRRTR